MGTLLNEWIHLFDEKSFESLQNEPAELKNVTMLFITIQKEFKRVESLLSNRIKILRYTNEENKKREREESEDDDIHFIESSPSKENIQNDSNLSGCHKKTLMKSPVFLRHRKSIFKKTKKKSNDLNMTQIGFPVNKMSNTTQTPNPSNKKYSEDIAEDDIFESSIIGVTPNINLSKKSHIKIKSPKRRLYAKNTSRNSTLTQIFSEMKSNETTETDKSNMMSITEILNEVDKVQESEPDKKTVVRESGAVSKDKWLSKKKASSFFQDYDVLPKTKKSPPKNFVFKETVRGNEKLKLKGWSCKDCEQFYKGMNLSEEELQKKMDYCSKHKGRFKPDNETMPGFWDLTIPPTPEDKSPQPSTSTQESIGHDSTIFCFYK